MLFLGWGCELLIRLRVGAITVGSWHFVPTSNLLKIYHSLIEPYISYGLISWAQAANSSLNKILILQKLALRLMYFSDRRAHAIPMFVRSAVLPLNMLYFKYSATLLHDISNIRAPSKISELFARSNMIHSHYTRFSAAVNFYIQRSRLSQLLLSFSRSGVRIWNKIPLTLREQRADSFKRKLHKLLIKVLETKKVYVDMSTINSFYLNSLFS